MGQLNIVKRMWSFQLGEMQCQVKDFGKYVASCSGTHYWQCFALFFTVTLLWPFWEKKQTKKNTGSMFQFGHAVYTDNKRIREKKK